MSLFNNIYFTVFNSNLLEDRFYFEGKVKYAYQIRTSISIFLSYLPGKLMPDIDLNEIRAGLVSKFRKLSYDPISD